MRLGHRPGETLGEPDGAAEHPHVCGQKGEKPGEPPEREPARQRPDSEPGTDQNERVRDPVGQVVPDLPSGTPQAAFDREEAVEHVAEEAQLNAGGRGEETDSARFTGSPER